MLPTRTTANDDEEKALFPSSESPAPPPSQSLSTCPYAQINDSAADDHQTPLLPRWDDGRRDEEAASSSSPRSARTARFPSPPLSPSYAARRKQARRTRRIQSLSFTVAVLAFVAIVVFSVAVVGWAGMVMYQRHVAYGTAVFAPAMVPEPVDVEGRVEPFRRWGDDVEEKSTGGAESPAGLRRRAAAVQAELDERLLAIDLPHSTALSCADIVSDSSLFSRYSPLQNVGSSSSHARSGPTLFVVNLYNSAHILPSLSRTFLSLASFLGPSTIHISIFENGSTDNTTLALSHLAAALTALGTPHIITSDPRKTDWKMVERITQLSLYRNVVLEPLEEVWYNDSTPMQDVVFLNDVFVCPRDVLELVFQRKVQKADAACAMDWRDTEGLARWWSKGVSFYDNWVSRSLTGHMLRPRFDVWAEWRDGMKVLWDHPREAYSRKRFEKGVPIPVYSCWNGMLALDALPLASSFPSPRYAGPADENGEVGERRWKRTKPVQTSDKPTRFRAAFRREGECSASECKTFAKDLWARGFDRWMIVPSVRVTYAQSTYSHPQLLALSSLNPASTSQLSLSSPPPSSPSSLNPLDELIDWSALKPPSSVVCFDWVRTWSIDIEWWRATYELPFPTARVLKWVDETLRRRR
ncbi:hypothetical protein JCM8547_001164 [Rhodosporidiobolus lusitaniae]